MTSRMSSSFSITTTHLCLLIEVVVCERVALNLKMDSIQVYDEERNVMFEIYVPKELKKQAESDMEFASQLVAEALKERAKQKIVPENPESETTTVPANPADTTPENPPAGPAKETEVLANPSTAPANQYSVPPAIEEIEDDVSMCRWNTPCTLLLLEIYKIFEQKFMSGKTSHKKIWEEIASKVREKGFVVTGNQCSSKLRSLKKTYRSIKDHNKKSGNDRRQWQFLDIMDEIFERKAWAHPVTTASSSGIIVNRETDSENSTCTQRSTKPSMHALMEKRMKQKEAHEANRNRRHQERMEVKKKLISVLEEISKKLG